MGVKGLAGKWLVGRCNAMRHVVSLARESIRRGMIQQAERASKDLDRQLPGGQCQSKS